MGDDLKAAKGIGAAVMITIVVILAVVGLVAIVVGGLMAVYAL